MPRPAVILLFASLGLLVACSSGSPLAREGAPVSAPSSVAAQIEEPEHEAELPASVPTQRTSQATPVDVAIPTQGAVTIVDWRPPPYPVPWAIRPEDHFFFARPIPSGEVNWPHPRFRYGNTHFGEEPTHTGVDLAASRGTPVLAAGPGEVVWAGYGLYRGLEDPTDPYGLAVAIRHDFGYGGQQLYTAYGHMSSIDVWVGQRVGTHERLGIIGDTGRASGIHLHFEVRLGDNRFFSSRNPELWMVPPEGWGVLAGRILNTFDVPLEEYLVQIRNLDTDQRWEVWTYAEDTVHPDDFYQENFVISDLPAGPYEIQVNFVGRAFKTHLFVYPGQTNFIIFQGRNGFLPEPTPTAPSLSAPPSP